VAWATYQAQESFCDFFGLKLFGTCYLHALAYLLAPGMVWRPTYYPSLFTRFENLVTAAKEYHIEVPDGFDNMVMQRPLPEHWSEREKFLTSLSDDALQQNVGDIIDLAKAIIKEIGIQLPSNKTANEIVERFFEKTVPCRGKVGLANILNAAWKFIGQNEVWAGYAQMRHNERKCLMEIVLKAIEILEIEERVGITP